VRPAEIALHRKLVTRLHRRVATVACTGARVVIEFTIRSLGAAATLVGQVMMNKSPPTAMSAAGDGCQLMTPSTFNSNRASAKLCVSVALSAATTTLLVDRVLWEKIRG